MPHLARFRVSGLFHTHSYECIFDRKIDSVQALILTGPNGSGKTHVLRLIRAMQVLDMSELCKIPFAEAEITYRNNAIIRCVQGASNIDSGVELSFYDAPANSDTEPFFSIREDQIEDRGNHVDALHRTSLDSWRAPYRSQTISSKRLLELARPFRSHLGLNFDLVKEAVERQNVSGNPWPVFVDTKRLDHEYLGDDPAVHARSRRPSDPEFQRAARSPMAQYMQRIGESVSSARRLALEQTQALSADFINRAMTRAESRDRVSEPELRREYAKLEETHRALAANSLTEDQSTPVEFPEHTTPTMRTLLTTYLEDWSARLTPYEDVNRKMTLLREILDHKMNPSGKHVTFDSRGSLQVRRRDRRIPIDRLSSGEQHLLALYILLLFGTEEGATVLIDEPEISLHVAWQEEFLSDIVRIAQIRDLSVVVATHSPSIISDYWDVVHELQMPSADEDEEELLSEDLSLLGDGDGTDEEELADVD